MKISGEENNVVILRELGERIQDLRVSEAMTQADLAKRSGVSPKTIERMENGENTNLFNLLNVMRALGILSNIQDIVSEKRTSPNELHERGKKRQRATRKQKDTELKRFVWGDEQ